MDLVLFVLIEKKLVVELNNFNGDSLCKKDFSYFKVGDDVPRLV